MIASYRTVAQRSLAQPSQCIPAMGDGRSSPGKAREKQPAHPSQASLLQIKPPALKSLLPGGFPEVGVGGKRGELPSSQQPAATFAQHFSFSLEATSNRRGGGGKHPLAACICAVAFL